MAKLSKSLIRLTGELERYQGSGSPPVSPPAEGSPPQRLAGPATGTGDAEFGADGKPRRKFSWLQSIEIPRNGKGIDWLVVPSPFFTGVEGGGALR